MSLRATQVTLVAAILALTIGTSFSVRAGDAPPTRKNTPAAKSGAPAKKAKSDAPKADAEKRTPLKLAVDAKPIDRNAPDRISYAPVVKRTASSVVYVHSSKRVRPVDTNSFLSDPRLRRFFDGLGIPMPESDDDARTPPRGNNRNNRPAPAPSPRNRSPESLQQGLGSGVIVTADGYILTNNHVIEGADEVQISIGESPRRYDATVVGRDAFSDLAVLKIDATGLAPATFGDSDQLQVGDAVLAIGNPFGVGQSVSRGIVSALSRGVGIGPIEDFIQTDAAINPGNSGGALIDTDGRVVGINTAILSRSGGFAGVGFAIPSNLARTIAEQIVAHGKVHRGFLGVAPQDISDDLAEQFGTEKGAIIGEVTPDSPAEKAGIKAGDVIVKINQTEIRDSRHLLLVIGQNPPGAQVSVDYLRDGKRATASVKLARRPDAGGESDERTPAEKSDVGVLNGVGVGDITRQFREQLQIPERIKGAIVTSIDPDSPSAKQGLREGDIILDLDQKPVADADEAVKLSEEIAGPRVLVRIWRNGRIHFLAIDESKK